MALNHLFLSLLSLTILSSTLDGASCEIQEAVITAEAGNHESFKMGGFASANFFPQGDIVPPSGPSKRHNGVTSSAVAHQDVAP
ncbi:hypothetical protein OPV22_018847 [Ensete ventricosum]|uniref:Uncharacterized protein n=1 Tax=Ensete ventricosum TaxID=4639 RepID=A0AAV8QV47_ENSVE|nr:hypothetical protein OPV22_018847 [Ensete ventricosum]